ncbi:MAG: RluA family pseudouridine synthase [candidate division Zixibacteria bacterium]|nr:RluA family pseudouridine synthase [candidate division Zixibacteria bacterium]
MTEPTAENGEWKKIVVEPLEAPIRLDKYLGQREDLELSRTKAMSLINDGNLLVNGKPAIGKQQLFGGEEITYVRPPEPVSTLIAENIPLSIIYEDEHIVVVNKPSGMVTHPGAGNFTGTLVNALLYHIESLPRGVIISAEDARPGIVHRLDKDTSGLLLVAKNEQIAQNLQQAIARRDVKRIYSAVTCGHFPDDEGTIDLPIARSHKDRTLMIVTKTSGRESVTHYKVLDRFRLYDYLEVRLETGRTHQIRVHLSHLNHPVLGDFEYGGREKWHRGIFAPERPHAKKLLGVISHQALHAGRLEFDHPVTKKPLVFEAPLPEDFATVLEILKTEGR